MTTPTGLPGGPILTKSMSLLDSTFLQLETFDTPMHVASLQIFRMPEGSPADFVRQVVEAYRNAKPTSAPWTLKLRRFPLSGLVPSMQTDNDIDMFYHVRHSALPNPGGERELGELISHLHGQQIDRSRPLWCCHIIDGLSDGRFAIYLKIHHAICDGMKGMRMVGGCLATTPGGEWTPPWQWKKTDSGKRQAHSASLRTKISGLRPATAHLVKSALQTRNQDEEPVRRAFEAPRSVLNGKVTAARRVATQSLDMARMQAIGNKCSASLNDVFLALCGGALRRYLEETATLPEQPLIAAIPVSLRAPDDVESSNAIGFLWSSLATDQKGPLERLEHVRRSMKASKEHLNELPLPARPAYTMATMASTIAVLMSGLGAKMRPAMNLTISNVPGPGEELYLKGATLEAMYPVSIPIQGLGLNITCISYASKLNVGFVGSRDALPHLQRMAVYIGEAIEELETAVTDARDAGHIG